MLKGKLLCLGQTEPAWMGTALLKEAGVWGPEGATQEADEQGRQCRDATGWSQPSALGDP